MLSFGILGIRHHSFREQDESILCRSLLLGSVIQTDSITLLFAAKLLILGIIQAILLLGNHEFNIFLACYHHMKKSFSIAGSFYHPELCLEHFQTSHAVAVFMGNLQRPGVEISYLHGTVEIIIQFHGWRIRNHS